MFDLRSPDPGRYPWSCHLSLQHRISRRFLQVSGATSVEAKLREIVRQPTWSHLKGIDLCQVLTKWTRSFVSVKRQVWIVWQFDRRSWDGFVWEFTIHIPHVPAKRLQCPVCVWFSGDKSQVLLHLILYTGWTSKPEWWCCLPHKFDHFMSCVCNVFSQEPW